MSNNIERLKKLRADFKAQDEKKKNNGNNNSSKGDVYPFWNMDEGQKAVIRIIPDKNEDNPKLFYVEKLEHKISLNGKDRKIPCLQQYGEKCPICDLSSAYYKSEGKGSANGKYYWRSKTSMIRGLVLSDPLPSDDEVEPYEGRVCKIPIGYQLMEKIRAEISATTDDEEFDFLSFENGYDFSIAKTPQGEYGTYAIASGFARRPSAIKPELIEKIELVDLETLLPRNPGADKVQAMLTAHLNGETYDDGNGESADASGNDDESKTVVKPKTETVVKPKTEVTPPPVKAKEEKVVEADPEEDGESVLDQIRKRRAAKAAEAATQ